MLGVVLYGLDKLHPFLELAQPTRGVMGKLLLASRAASAIRLARRPGKLMRKAALHAGMAVAGRLIKTASGRHPRY